SPDSKTLVSLSSEQATVWRWRDEIVDADRQALSFRLSSARQLNGFSSEAEEWLELPGGVPRPKPTEKIAEAARKLLAGPPTHDTIAAAAECVLEAPDPALGWIELYTALDGRSRSNGHRLLVLEEIDRVLSRSVFSRDDVLRLLLDATRAAGLR